MKKLLIVIAFIIIFLGGLAYGRLRYFQPHLLPKSQTTNSQIPTPMLTGAFYDYDKVYQVKTDPKKGKYLADFQGVTLYTYDKDTKGISNCTDGCLSTWPVYTFGSVSIPKLPQNITIIKRPDGRTQFAWKGKPLYSYYFDKNPGDMFGDDLGKDWHIAKP